MKRLESFSYLWGSQIFQDTIYKAFKTFNTLILKTILYLIFLIVFVPKIINFEILGSVSLKISPNKN